ncbi:MAG: hypothetical protein AB7N91_19005 [Candidatus Tectimicrobiota bacterium]
MARADTATKPSLAARLGTLAESGIDFRQAPAEAQTAFESLRQDYPEVRKWLEQRFTRLPAAHQQIVLALLAAQPLPEWTALLAQWSRQESLPISTRAQALTLLGPAGTAVEAPYREHLQQAEHLRQQLAALEPAPVDDAGALLAPWPDEVARLPLPLTLQVAQELAPEHSAVALALLKQVRPTAQGAEALSLVDTLGNIPCAGSASMLQEMFLESVDKNLHKAVKRAAHRLKVHGVAVDDKQLHRPGAAVGGVAHRLERCLASFIDGAGDRILLLIRTKPLGGYNMAYLVINYGTGIRYALGLQASKRELPDILARIQGPAPLIELEPTYCQYQIALAHQMNLDTRTPVPEEYFTLHDIIGECQVTFARGIIYSALSEADLEAARTFEPFATDLLALPEFAGWTLPTSIIQKYGDALRELESSQIVVSQSMRQERINEIQARAMDEVLSEASRRIMRLRLEEMAYYLLRTERRREALWAVAAAQSLEDDNPHRLRRNPFAGALLERSLEVAKARPSSGRIITPYTQLPGGSSTASGGSESRIII